MTRRLWLIGILCLVALFGAAGFMVFRQPPALAGTVVDARSGRVAAGAVISYDGRVLRRFRQKSFAFAGGAGQVGPMTIEAPGYAPATLTIAAGQESVAVSLEPKAIPGLTGVVVFPKLKDGRLDLPAQLLGPDGAAMPEFPAVELKARVVITSAAGAPVGYLDLEPTVDYAAADIALSLGVDIAALAEAARPNGATFAVAVKAGDAVVASRPFALPPQAIPDGSAP